MGYVYALVLGVVGIYTFALLGSAVPAVGNFFNAVSGMKITNRKEVSSVSLFCFCRSLQQSDFEEI